MAAYYLLKLFAIKIKGIILEANKVSTSYSTGWIAGCKIEFDFWGFSIWLNEDIVKDFKKYVKPALESQLQDVAKENTKFDNIEGLILAYVLLMDDWCNSVDKGYGVALNAIWIAPLILVPTALNKGDVPPPEDEKLYWTVYDPETRKNSKMSVFINQSGLTSPALAELNGNLHCVHRGSHWDNMLYYTKFEANKTNPGKHGAWTPASYIGFDDGKHSGPSIVAFEGKLYVVLHTSVDGGNNHSRVVYVSENEKDWTEIQLPSYLSIIGDDNDCFCGSSFTIFGNDLVLLTVTIDKLNNFPDNGKVFMTEYRDGKWESIGSFKGDNIRATTNVSFGEVYMDGYATACLATVDSNHNLCISYISMEPALTFSHTHSIGKTETQPSLVVDHENNEMYCVARGNDTRLWVSKYEGNRVWSAPTFLTDSVSNDGPAAIFYKTEHSKNTESNMLIVQRGAYLKQ
jgi:hypothetical protein